MTILQSIILGIVEGITEFLPISSTGHLILASKLLQIVQSDFVKSFEIIIQLGAIAAVIVFYFKTLLKPETLKKLIVAFIPTAVVGLVLYKVVKTYLIGNELIVLTSLFVGGILIILFEMWYKRQSINSILQSAKPTETKHEETITCEESKEADVSNISYKQSFIIGLYQSIAIIPGVSRSAATIIGGMSLGISRKAIVEFSFLLAVPTMVAASGLDIVKNIHLFTSANLVPLTVGFAVSFVVAMASIVFLLNFVKKYGFIPFGVYRIIISALFFLALFY